MTQQPLTLPHYTTLPPQIVAPQIRQKKLLLPILMKKKIIFCKNGFDKKEEIRENKNSETTEWAIRPDAKWKVRSIGLLAAILPGIACYLCLAYSFTLQYDRIANFTIPSTMCPGLKSIFPPVSYSIGVWKPQKYIWLMVLAMHLPPRFFYAIVYKNHYSLGDSIHRTKRWFCVIVKLHYFLLVIEALGLTAVSVIDIESNFSWFLYMRI
uniref:CWH43-like N-terminal domain-containing protein n=1 Tax=Meloidogyne enterolobii TaxID=390850 RepID=A0A6V7X8R2_MELEN|nr:unnamed protein product [Meloidogyne enterolobii]